MQASLSKLMTESPVSLSKGGENLTDLSNYIVKYTMNISDSYVVNETNFSVLYVIDNHL